MSFLSCTNHFSFFPCPGLQERTTYERLAKRVLQQEKHKAAAHLLLPSAGRRPAAAPAPASARRAAPAEALPPAAAAAGAAQAPGAASGSAVATAAGADSSGEAELGAAVVVEFGASYEELIRITRMRYAARRAAHATAVQQQQQQQRQEEQGEDQEVQQLEQQEEEQGEEQEEQQLEQQEAPATADEGWWEEDDSSGVLWGEDLPLSQSQQGEWQLRAQRHAQHAQQRQQEQHPPNAQHRLAQGSSAGCLAVPPEAQDGLVAVAAVASVDAQP